MLAADVRRSEQSAQKAYFAQVSWCNGKATLGLQAACLGLGFCSSVSKSAQMLSFPSCRLVDSVTSLPAALSLLANQYY